ncbi:TetR/AcrR family transcriptional regulator [Rufibacter glacialis]|uniref:TetR/AcrR family transcriptional regulator n=1 Tax=Rufibacter glacialis TaxID=1259555 RepID=A0A5M8QI16_9BACT|nr:TetR/AcrR family transcriptional regulator [Rufibacter glacialis]KAA6435669.1 TetR/AcrR family transcriptional regulator [Rufibacter glacialis]GGK65389.1 TetR family transcriptional regulator [Rufibacter glacialis]
MSTTIKIQLNEKLFLRDPEQTELGRTIFKESIRLIDDLGFEHFTFKKLAQQISSTEASIYRYFENKHKLLLYLVSWYWNWLDYRISYQTHNVSDATQKLKTFIAILAEHEMAKPLGTDIDVNALGRIVIMEASKAYLTKEVDSNNQDGLFQDYKNLCHKMALVVLEVNPRYPFPHALVSTLFETARKQMFFAQHLPSLTEVKVAGHGHNSLADFLNHLAFTLVGHVPETLETTR